MSTAGTGSAGSLNQVSAKKDRPFGRPFIRSIAINRLSVNVLAAEIGLPIVFEVISVFC
jgi:hypothetical protein